MRNISRLLLGILLLFELSNQFGLLHFTLDFTWFGLVITGAVIWLFVEGASYILEKRSGRPIPGIIFLLVLVAVYVDALGDILHFYGRFYWYDEVAHLIGGATAAGILFFMVWTSLRHKIKALGISLFSLGISSFLGVLYEIEEYLEDLLTGSHRLGDGPDTASDLLFNTLGALFVIGLMVSYFYRRRKITAKD